MSLFLSSRCWYWKCSNLSKTPAKHLFLRKLNGKPPKNYGNLSIIRQMSLENQSNTTGSTFVPFNDLINFRRNEAQRSIIVQVQSEKSVRELHSYCSALGTVTKMIHYTTGVEPLHFIIVEFANSNEVQEVLHKSSFIENSQVVPVYSPFMWFRAAARKQPKLKQTKNVKLEVENGNNILKDGDIKEALKNCSSISDQMSILYDLTKLNDVGTRLRFLTAYQVEKSVSGMFPNARAFPFGSSVNGFGKMGCDLDLVLRLNDTKDDDTSRLVFHCKASSGSERSSSQRNMEAIGDLLQLFLPGCAQVRRILQARVPIIKYYQQLTDVECDLSMSNMSGVHMSDFLYIMGSIDSRVKPLIYTVRKWASEVGLTNSSPGRWITNFSLTLLVLAFLQKPLSSPPILPSLNTLVRKARANDKYITEDGINCTFLRDINTLNEKTQNVESLDILLREFFEFYSVFDFSTKAVCLNEAVSLTKPEHSAMYIVNPLERGLNVSKNVSLEELERFKSEVRNAAWTLESQENQVSNWGLLSIFNNKRKNSLALNHFLSAKNNRLMEVSTLFEEGETAEHEEENEQESEVDFKSDKVKKQVVGIKRDTRNKLKELNSQIQKANR